MSESAKAHSDGASSPDLNLKALLQMMETNVGTGTSATTSTYNFSLQDSEDSNSNSSIIQHNNSLDESQLYLALDNQTDNQITIPKPISIQRNIPISMQTKFVNEANNTGCSGEPWGYSIRVPTKTSVCSEEPCLYSSSNNYYDNSERINANVEAHFSQYSPSYRSIGHRVLSKSKGRGRRKKPIHQFHSELFMRPYFRREQSPQLQLVKLVRQKALEKKNEDEEAALVLEQMALEKEKAELENPELAFMKTIDMPSGKRVEDIYVVPSVWISNEKKRASESGVLEANMADNDSSNPRMDESPHVPYNIYSNEGHHSTLSAASSQQYRHILPTPYPPAPARRKLMALPVLPGHIITTLNASKVEPVPSLKELCQVVLGFQGAICSIGADMIESTVTPTKTDITCYEQEFSDNLLDFDENISVIRSPKEFLDMKEEISEDKSSVAINNCSVPLSECNQEASTVLSECISEVDMILSELENKEDETGNDISKMPDLSPSQPLDFVLENPLIKLEHKRVVHCDLKDVHGTNIFPKAVSVFNHGHECSNDQEQHTAYDTSRLVSNENEQIALHSESNFAHNVKSCPDNNSVIPVEHGNAHSMHLQQSECESQNHSLTLLPQAGSRNDIMNPTHNFDSSTQNLVTHAPSCKTSIDDALTAVGELKNLEIDSSVISIAGQIKSLSLLEPLNKPLTDLAATLNILCNAERTLYNANYAAYSQIKFQRESKMGGLSLCILKLGDAISTMGNTLQSWNKTPGENNCLKTVSILTDSFNANILSLIDLITPYFHFICQLIANGRMDPSTKTKHFVSEVSKENTSFARNSEESSSIGRWYNPPAMPAHLPSNPPQVLTQTAHTLASQRNYTEKNLYYSPNSATRNNCGHVLRPIQNIIETSNSFKIKAGTKRNRPIFTNTCQKQKKISLLGCRKPYLQYDQQMCNQALVQNMLSKSASENALNNDVTKHQVSFSDPVQDPSESFCHKMSLTKVHHTNLQPANSESFSKPDQTVTTWMLPVRSYCSTGNNPCAQQQCPVPNENKPDVYQSLDPDIGSYANQGILYPSNGMMSIQPLNSSSTNNSNTLGQSSLIASSSRLSLDGNDNAPCGSESQILRSDLFLFEDESSSNCNIDELISDRDTLKSPLVNVEENSTTSAEHCSYYGGLSFDPNQELMLNQIDKYEHPLAPEEISENTHPDHEGITFSDENFRMDIFSDRTDAFDHDDNLEKNKDSVSED